MNRDTNQLPREGRLAGIDYGTVRVGVAISDPSQLIASPVANYARRCAALDTEWFRDFVERESVVGFVVGLPIHMSGDESQKSAEARQFGAWLTEQTGVPVDFHDERHTSADAETHLLAAKLTKKRRQARRDMVAAQLILNAYLAKRRS